MGGFEAPKFKFDGHEATDFRDGLLGVVPPGSPVQLKCRIGDATFAWRGSRPGIDVKLALLTTAPPCHHQAARICACGNSDAIKKQKAWQ